MTDQSAASQTDSEQPVASEETAQPVPEAPRHVNSVDATMGQPLIARVVARKQELEAVLGGLPEDETRERADIEHALGTLESLMTGDLAHVPAVVAVDLNTWLERHKHLAESAVDTVAEPMTEVDAATDAATDAKTDAKT
ncbi:MAG: hypothetical protein M3680_24755 [Myxococcota bacterium]|nr:hypothetical protein [Myxococcota bacterium]